MEDSSTYAKRGVSSGKEGVHRAVRNAGSDRGLFPGAFCQIFADFLSGSEDYCLTQHSDGTGTKLNAYYILWKLLHDGREDRASVLEGAVQDSLVMNIDDLICVGATGPFTVSQVINRNPFRITQAVLEVLISRCQSFCEFLSSWGIECHTMGGETADVGDLVRTATVDNTIIARLRRDEIIDASKMRPGDIIVGFSSVGQAIWEDKPNSGIGSNGLTNARHDLLGKLCWSFTETFSPEVDESLIYKGRFLPSDPLPGSNMTIGEALTSPTRTYAPLVKRILEAVPRGDIHGLIHCSGGGQTKIGKFGRPGNVYVKNDLFEPPPLFRVIQEESDYPWKEMFACYNMGHRFEAIVETQTAADMCIAISRECGIDSKVVGRVCHSSELEIRGKRQVVITAPFIKGEPLKYSFS